MFIFDRLVAVLLAAAMTSALFYAVDFLLQLAVR